MVEDERETQRIEPGMDVCDLDGKKLGTVVDLRPVTGAPGGPGNPTGGEVIEVKTGFMGLGKHFYIPLDAVRDASEAGVFLRQRRDEMDTSAWEQTPEVSAPGQQDLRAPTPEVSQPSGVTSAPSGAPEMGQGAPPGAAPATAAAQAPAQARAAAAASTGTAPEAAARTATGSTGSGTTTSMGQGGGAWSDVTGHYRSRWEEHYGQQGANWESYEPRYRFAWELGRDPELAGRGWYTAQPALRDAWERREPDTSWDQVADTVRDAWEHPAE
jgi:hypothetical protein